MTRHIYFFLLGGGGGATVDAGSKPLYEEKNEGIPLLFF